jgi:hypothetical protein
MGSVDVQLVVFDTQNLLAVFEETCLLVSSFVCDYCPVFSCFKQRAFFSWQDWTCGADGQVAVFVKQCSLEAVCPPFSSWGI